jgi:hypothetical protein
MEENTLGQSSRFQEALRGRSLPDSGGKKVGGSGQDADNQAEILPHAHDAEAKEAVGVGGPIRGAAG